MLKRSLVSALLVGFMTSGAVGVVLAKESTVTGLCERAKQGPLKERYAAVDDLGELAADPETAVPVLATLLADRDTGVRWRAARSLGDFGPLADSAVADLRGLLAKDEPIVRMQAVVALARIGDRSDETVRALIDRATDEEPRVARVAIAALRRLKLDPELVVGALAKVLESKDAAVTSHALEALIEAGGNATPLLKQALKKPATAYLACVAVEAIGPPAAGTLPELLELIADTAHSKLETEAILAVAKIGPAAKPAAPTLEKLLMTPADSTVPSAAAYALGAIGADVAIPALEKFAAEQADPFRKMVASWSLAKLQPNNEQVVQSAVERLTQGLTSDDAKARSISAKGLQQLDAPSEVVAPALLKVAQDPDPVVRGNVLEALASLGGEVVPKAIQGLDDPKARLLAVRLLARLGKASAPAVGRLTTLLDEADDAVLPEVNLALASIGPAAAPATERLGAALASDSARVRHTALRALHHIGPGAAAAKEKLLMLATAEDVDPVDCVVASWALTSVADGDADVAGRILLVLERGLENGDKGVRLRAIEALVDLGPAAAAAVPALNQIAQEDDDSGVREEAELAVKTLSAGE